MPKSLTTPAVLLRQDNYYGPVTTLVPSRQVTVNVSPPQQDDLHLGHLAHVQRLERQHGKGA